MRVLRYHPLRPLRRLRPSAAATAARPVPREASWAPPVDIREESDRYVIVADVAGVDPAAIEVKTDDGVLSIEGERDRPDGPGPNGALRSERAVGRFARRFSLPDTVDAAGITAAGRHGVLEIAIPKHDGVRSRRIQVS